MVAMKEVQIGDRVRMLTDYGQFRKGEVVVVHTTHRASPGSRQWVWVHRLGEEETYEGDNFLQAGEYELVDDSDAHERDHCETDLLSVAVRYIQDSEAFDAIEREREKSFKELQETFHPDEFPLVVEMPDGRTMLITSYDIAQVADATVVK